MKKKLSFSLLSLILLLTLMGDSAAGSPTAVISAGSGSGKPGDTNISAPINLQSQDGAQVAGMNFDLSFDDKRMDVSNVTIGSSASSAGKIISWSRPSSDTLRVIIFGLNQDPIPSGTVANVIFNVLESSAPGTSPLTLSHAAATDPSGGGIGIKLNHGSFTVLTPPATTTPTIAPTDPPVATSTPTSAPTDPPIPTHTSTIAPTVSPTPTVTTSLGPSPAGGPSTTPEPTKTGIPSASATSEITPTGSVTPTQNLTISSEASASPTDVLSASPTLVHEGENLTDHEWAAGATGTAEAELEAAVEATATALALIGKGSTANGEDASGLSCWLQQWGDAVLFGGIAASLILLVITLISEVTRRKISMQENLTKKERRV
jgi:hypothetical protein